ncbi:MAG: TetR/AcrR family transcriptional regulator [Alphaproteobacteria bacterium]|nr:TetR/AcrR family transcriptional regulator [Alphaproteobacteria bacterium]
MTDVSEPKWRRRADERPDEVLDAALQLFVRNGFAATKVEDIARDAGLSKGAIYRYFSSKEDIFESLVKRALTPIADHTSIVARTSQADPAMLLRGVLTMLSSRLSDPDTLALPRLVLMEAGKFPALAAAYRRQVVDKALLALETIVQRGVDEGTFRPVNPHYAVRNIIGPVLAHVLIGEIFGIDKEPEPIPAAFIDSHFDILINGLANTGQGG